MRLKSGFPFIIIAILLTVGCAASRPDFVISAPAAIPQIKRVGVAPVTISPEDKLLYENIDVIVPQILAQGFGAKDLFELVPVDSLKKFTPVGDGGSDELWLETGKAIALDAVLFTAVQFSEQRIPGLNALDANVEIRIVDTSTDQEIVSSTYNTADKKTYKTAPTPEKVTFDATVGAMRPIIKGWQEN